MSELDERIRAALHAAVDHLAEGDLRPALPPRAVPRQHRTIRWTAPLLAAAAVVAVVVISLAVPSGTQSAKHGVPPAGSFSPTPTGTTSPDTSARESRAAAAASEAASKAALRARLAQLAEQQLLGYEPLWPFATPDAAHAWETANAKGGHASWHLDAGQTALSFARSYLKFSDITEVTSTQVTAKDAHIGVGYPSPGGQPHTAAVLHLLRFAADPTDTSAPWEVVGATASDFSLVNLTAAEVPGRMLTVQGQITGADENIAVTLRTLRGDVTTHAPVPAGGTDSAWTVAVHSGLRGVITVVASTGGHTTAHERFVVSGIKVP